MTTRFVAVLFCVVASGALHVSPSRSQDPSPRERSFLSSEARVAVFLNGEGGRYFAAARDDGAHHRSSVVWRQGLTHTDVPRFRGTRDEWQSLVRCVESSFAGLPIDVHERSTSREELTVVIGGNRDVLRTPYNGLAALTAGEVTDRGIAFVFSDRYTHLANLCISVAHEVGHLLGLEHGPDCADLMGNPSCDHGDLTRAFTAASRSILASSIERWRHRDRQYTPPGTPIVLRDMHGRCMDVDYAMLNDGARIASWGCHRGANQRWSLHDDGTIRTGANRCLDFSYYEDHRVHAWGCHGGPNQRWTLRPNGQIEGVDGRCLDLDRGEDVNGGRLIAWPCHDGANQRFRVTHL